MPIRGTPLASDIAVVDAVVDGIQADLDNTTDGLGALKTHIRAVPLKTTAEMAKIIEVRANEKHGAEDAEVR